MSASPEQVTTAMEPLTETRFAGTSAPPPLAIARPDGQGALRRLEVAANRTAALVVYRVRRVGLTSVAGIALLVAAVTLFLFRSLPQAAVVADLKARLAVPAQPVAKASTAAANTTNPLASLPSRGDAPAVIDKLLEEAEAAGVDLPRGEYEFLPARDGIAARYAMTFPIHASYPKLRAFMDRTLIALPAVAVEGLRIERKSVGTDVVDAELKLSAFVRGDE